MSDYNQHLPEQAATSRSQDEPPQKAASIASGVTSQLSEKLPQKLSQKLSGKLSEKAASHHSGSASVSSKQSAQPSLVSQQSGSTGLWVGQPLDRTASHHSSSSNHASEMPDPSLLEPLSVEKAIIEQSLADLILAEQASTAKLPPPPEPKKPKPVEIQWSIFQNLPGCTENCVRTLPEARSGNDAITLCSSCEKMVRENKFWPDDKQVTFEWKGSIPGWRFMWFVDYFYNRG